MGTADERVLVTGGAGFIGSHVTRAFVDHGADVDVVDTLVSGRPEYVPEDATLHQVDIRSEGLEDVVTSCDPTIVIHLAARHYIPYCNDHPEETFEVNVMGTRSLLDCARDLRELNRVVYASTAAVYPPREGPNPETSPTGPTDVYGRTKLVGEDLCRLFEAETGIPTVSARLFNTYGPHETNEHVIPAILDQVRGGADRIELGNLTPKRDFVHVFDVTRALAGLARTFENGYGVYNVGTGQEYSVEELVDTVADVLDRDIVVEQRAERVRESDRPHLRADVSRIERDLDWTPEIDIETGLRDLMAAEGMIDAERITP